MFPVSLSVSILKDFRIDVDVCVLEIKNFSRLVWRVICILDK